LQLIWSVKSYIKFEESIINYKYPIESSQESKFNEGQFGSMWQTLGFLQDIQFFIPCSFLKSSQVGLPYVYFITSVTLAEPQQTNKTKKKSNYTSKRQTLFCKVIYLQHDWKFSTHVLNSKDSTSFAKASILSTIESKDGYWRSLHWREW
jgi:hypothetical protein